MGQSKPFRATALIVEDDIMQREMLCVLLEESGYDVIQCESAEAAERVLEKSAGALCLICLLYTSPSPRDGLLSRMPSSA